MTIQVDINTIENNDNSWTMTGITFDDRTEVEQPFEARSMIYQGSIIFKIVEDGVFNPPLKGSQYSRGIRIAIAKNCKAAMADYKAPPSPQLRLFNDDGTIHDDVKEPKIEFGTVITEVHVDADPDLETAFKSLEVTDEEIEEQQDKLQAAAQKWIEARQAS